MRAIFLLCGLNAIASSDHSELQTSTTPDVAKQFSPFTPESDQEKQEVYPDDPKKYSRSYIEKFWDKSLKSFKSIDMKKPF